MAECCDENGECTGGCDVEPPTCRCNDSEIGNDGKCVWCHMTIRETALVPDVVVDAILPELRERAERVAQAFHREYETQAQQFGWDTNKSTRTGWCDLPIENRRTMIFTVANLLIDGVIE